MSKKLTLIVLLACAAPGTWGQHSAGHIAFGLKGGFNYARMDMKPHDTLSPATFRPVKGAYLGGVFYYPLAQRWGLQPELLASVQGYKTDDPQGMFPHWTTYLGYVNFPLLLSYTPVRNVALYSGPQPGFLWHPDEDIRDMDLAWVVGAGYQAKKRLGVEARYSTGLVNVAEEPRSYSEFSKAKSRVLQVGIVYLLIRGRSASHKP